MVVDGLQSHGRTLQCHTGMDTSDVVATLNLPLESG
jgi:hypothetical protein